MSLSLVLPCFNEEATIERTVRSCIDWMTEKRITGEIIVVNDGSHDRSGAILAELKSQFPLLRTLSLETNQGYGIAVRSGIDAARMEWIAFMDSDGQFDIRDLERLLGCIPETDQTCVTLSVVEGRHMGRCDGSTTLTMTHRPCAMVTGRRHKRADSFLRNLYGKGLGVLTWVLFGLWVRDINCGMKVFKRDLWPHIRPVYGVEKMFNTELFLRLKTLGTAWRQVDVAHYPRRGGKSTGASRKVIFRMLKEIWKLKRGMRNWCHGERSRTIDTRCRPSTTLGVTPKVTEVLQSDYSASNSRTLDPTVAAKTDAEPVHPGWVRSR